MTDMFFCSFGEIFNGTGWFQGSFEGHLGRRRGRGPWERWKRRTRQDEGKERIWRDELSKVDGADSSEDKGRSQGIDGDGGFDVGGF